jgi:copper chaperone CopZ
MQSEIIKLKTATTQESMANAVQVLSTVEGVSAVTPSLIRNELNVQFNGSIASLQHLHAALDNAGYVVQTAKATGGCGGGGGGCSCS